MRLTDHDASFLYAETASTPMHGATITVLDGDLDFHTVCEAVSSRLHLLPRYRQRLVFVPFNLAHPKWVDDPDFDLSRHMFAHTLPPDASLEDGIQAALTLAEPLLPRNRPLWAMHVLSGLPGQTLLLQIAHHAMVDGASGVDVSMVLFDLQPNPPPVPPAPEWQPEPVPGAPALAAEAMRETSDRLLRLRNALEFTGERGELIRRATESLTRFVAEPVMQAPWNRGLVARKRNFAWRKHPFADIRQIRNTLGGTVNDVVLAIVVEAAARYIARQDADAEGRHLRVMCPVNVRREDERGALGNRVSAIFPMFDAEPMDMAERLKAVRWETESIKQSREAQALQLMAEAVPPLPPVAMASSQLVGTAWDPTAPAAQFPLPVMPSFGLSLPLTGFNFTCTNIPGVQTTQYLAGARVLDHLAVLMLGGNLGFGVAILSYDQALYFNLVCDPRLMSDLDLMAEFVDQTYNELRLAAATPTA